MKKKPLISVIMPCYNRAGLVRESIESALGQTYRELELIVVDDGSTDDCLQVLESIQKKDGRLKIISQENKGPSAARNTGLAEARGEFAAFLDSDDWWNERFLEKLCSALKANPDAALAYCGWQNVGVEGTGCRPFVPPNYEKKGNKAEIFLEGCRWPIHAALTRKSAIDEVEGFDEQLTSSMDYDLWLRIAPFQKIVLVPEVLAFYNHHGKGQITKKRVRAARNGLTIRKKFLTQNPEIAKRLGWARKLRFTYWAFLKKILGLENIVLFSALRKIIPWRLQHWISASRPRLHCLLTKGTLNPNTREYWNNIWNSNEEQKSIKSRKNLFRAVFDLIPENSRVLDVGCGDGRLLFMLKKQKHCEVFGLDISDKAGELLKEKGIDARRAALPKIPFPENYFDVVVGMEILEHLFNPRKALQSMKRVLKSNGLLVVTVPDNRLPRKKVYVHVTDFSQETLTGLLSEYLKNVSTESMAGSPKGPQFVVAHGTKQ